MFNFMGFGKTKQESAPVASVVVTTDADYVLTEKAQAAFDSLEQDENGMVKIGDVTHGMLNQQSQYITRYMDGSPKAPSLVDGLRVDVSSDSHHEYTIHHDDVLEFVARVKAHRSHR